jgi:hypothetical protein
MISRRGPKGVLLRPVLALLRPVLALTGVTRRNLIVVDPFLAFSQYLVVYV